MLHTVAYAGWPVLEFRLRIHWQEERKRLKLACRRVFLTPALHARCRAAPSDRPADGQEHVHRRWLMLTGQLDGRATAWL